MPNERSQFWDTTGVGDGNDTYSAFQWREMARALFSTDRYTTEGVLPGVTSSLAVSGSASPLSVSSGNAVVNGIYYQNTSPLAITVPTPSAGTTRHRIVLQALWGPTAQTVRSVLLSGTDGVATAYPTLTQQDNSRWEIPLAGVTITTSGAITLEDQRDYCHYAHALAYRRQGGSITNWSTAGTTNYKPGGARFQTGMGVVSWSGYADNSDPTTISFPQPYSQPPLVWANVKHDGATYGRTCNPSVESISNSSFKFRARQSDGTAITNTSFPFYWVALGPK